MSLGSAIHTLLRTNATINTTFKDRIYPILIPQNAPDNLPAITYQQTGLIHNDTKDEYSNVWNARTVQITVFAKTYALAETYCDLIETTLIRYNGVVGGETITTINLTDESFDAITDFTISGNSVGVSVFTGTMIFNIVTK